MAATSGICPICGEHFDEVERYTAHLADEHDLHDDHGAESSFGVVALAAPVPTAPQLQNDLIDAPQGRPAGPGDRGRPVGLIVLVLVLLLGFGALVAFGPDRKDRSDDVAQRTDEETATSGGHAGAGPPASAPGASPSGDGTTLVTSSGGAVPVDSGSSPGGSTTTAVAAPARGGSTAGPSATTTSTTTSSSTSTTTTPFAAPTAIGARIDGCQRTKQTIRITYSWLFSGGVGWHVPSGYTATGGGRYQDVVTVPRRGTTTITAVQVLDDGGTSHSVALQPALQSSAC